MENNLTNMTTTLDSTAGSYSRQAGGTYGKNFNPNSKR
jgi:hypothetical protein